MSVKYNLVRPCAKCPFRTDVPPYLTSERVFEIAHDVLAGSDFYCHQTTVPAPEDDEEWGSSMMAGDRTQVCAGSLILMEKTGRPNQMMRIAERLGMYDSSRLDMDAPVHASWVDMQQHFEEEEVVTCEIVGPNCEAPAGYAVGGGVVSGTEAAEYECAYCGRPVCGECSTEIADQRVCDDCMEEGEG